MNEDFSELLEQLSINVGQTACNLSTNRLLSTGIMIPTKCRYMSPHKTRVDQNLMRYGIPFHTSGESNPQSCIYIFIHLLLITFNVRCSVVAVK